MEIPNIFGFSYSINYEDREINYFISKELKSYNESNNNQNLQAISNSTFDSAQNTFRIDPPLLNNTNCNFYYNSKIFKLYHSNFNLPVKNLFTSKFNEEFLNCKNECDNTFTKMIPMQNKSNTIKFIQENSFYTTNKQKLQQRQEVKNFLMKVSNSLAQNSCDSRYLKERERELKLDKHNSINSVTSLSSNKSVNVNGMMVEETLKMRESNSNTK